MSPSRGELQPILVMHGLTGQVVPLPTGFVNWVYVVGDDVILRVTKPDIDPEDTYTEAVAVPTAVKAGIRTPRLITFDDSRSLIPYVYTLYERAPGVALAEVHVDQRELPSLYAELGREIAAIHNNITHVDDPNGWLDTPYYCDPRKELKTAREELKVELVTYDWIAKWNDKLTPAIESTAHTRFVHHDLHAGNTMVLTDPLRLSAVIDWGDACWGEPVQDMERVPIWALPWLLKSYHEQTGLVDEMFVGRALAHVLGTTLYKLCDPEFDPTPAPWHPFPSAFTFNLVRLMRMDLDDRWQRWLPDSPI